MLEDKLEFQRAMEERYCKYQEMRIVKGEFKKEEEIVNVIKNNNLPLDATLTLLAKLALMKRIRVDVAIGIMKKYEDSLDKVSLLIQRIGEAGLYKLSMDGVTLITKYLISSDVQERLNKFQFMPPMIIKPRRINNNQDSGYLSFKKNVILNQRKSIEDVCLDHINRVNGIKLILNMDTAWNTKNQWDCIDHPKKGETIEEYQHRRKQFCVYVKKAYETMELIAQFDGFYLTHSYDKRGRVYSNGYQINDQGTDWNKAVVEFANKEIINE